MQPLQRGWQVVQPLGRGVLVCGVVALAAQFIAGQHGGPVLLYALLFGLAFHFLWDDARLRPGIDFCARTLLRAGVALLGLRIGFDQVLALGWRTGLIALSAVALTIALGLALARWLRRPREEGWIAGCSVGICGASAALAVSSALPPTRENERFTLLAVVGVTLMSTLAMLIYPLLARTVGFSPHQAGVFFGATIHDVAQVVAAGMLLSDAGNTAAADSATVVKLFRVMLLMPVVLLVTLVNRSAPEQLLTEEGPRSEVPLLPGFLLAFVVFMLLHTSGRVPLPVEQGASAASKALLVLAIAAAGIKTHFADLLRLGWVPVIMLGAETLFIALWVGVLLALG